jgi:hypothetical protein
MGDATMRTNTTRTDAVTVRLASEHDERALDRLAQLDSARPPVGPTLVAELDGELVAAVPLREGRPVADPFRPTAEIVSLLQLRAAHLVDDTRRRRPLSASARRYSWLYHGRSA